MGADTPIVNLVRNIYSGSTSTISTGLGTTTPIQINAGIKQGCPLSGLLFNFAINHVLRALQSDAAEHRVLAFADMYLIVDSPDEL